MAKIERLKLREKLKISDQVLDFYLDFFARFQNAARKRFLYCLYLFTYLFIYLFIFFFSYRKRVAWGFTPLSSISVTFLLTCNFFVYFLVLVRKKRRSGVMHCDYLKV